MASPTDMEPTEPAGQTGTEHDQASRLRGYDKRVEEWLTSLKEEAGQRSPEVLSALAVKAKDVADYLEKMAEKARSRSEASRPTADTSQSEDRSAPSGGKGDYRGPDPETDPKGDGDDEDQGT